MTCASCVARVEKALIRVPGVSASNVNLASEAATVELEADASLAALLQAVVGAGYRIKEDELDLAIAGMTCASCVGRVERALLKVPGVLAATGYEASAAAAATWTSWWPSAPVRAMGCRSTSWQRIPAQAFRTFISRRLRW